MALEPPATCFQSVVGRNAPPVLKQGRDQDIDIGWAIGKKIDLHGASRTKRGLTVPIYLPISARNGNLSPTSLNGGLIPAGQVTTIGAASSLLPANVSHDELLGNRFAGVLRAENYVIAFIGKAYPSFRAVQLKQRSHKRRNNVHSLVTLWNSEINSEIP
jgi:hypothetical protein